MKLTVAQIQDILVGMNSLDGYEDAVNIGTEEKPTIKIIRKPYKFSGEFRFAMASNMVALTAVEQIFEKARKELVREYGEESVPPDKVKDFMKKLQGMREIERNVRIDQVDRKLLNIEQNPEFPIGSIFLLNPLWKPEPAEETKEVSNKPKAKQLESAK